MPRGTNSPAQDGFRDMTLMERMIRLERAHNALAHKIDFIMHTVRNEVAISAVLGPNGEHKTQVVTLRDVYEESIRRHLQKQATNGHAPSHDRGPQAEH